MASLTMCCRFGRRNARRSMREWALIPGSARRAVYEHYMHSEHAVPAPLQILLRLPPPGNARHWAETKQMELVVDAAGKVRSARIVTPLLDKDAVPAATNAPGAESNKDWLAAAAGVEVHPGLQTKSPEAISFHARCSARQTTVRKSSTHSVKNLPHIHSDARIGITNRKTI